MIKNFDRFFFCRENVWSKFFGFRKFQNFKISEIKKFSTEFFLDQKNRSKFLIIFFSTKNFQIKSFPCLFRSQVFPRFQKSELEKIIIFYPNLGRRGYPAAGDILWAVATMRERDINSTGTLVNYIRFLQALVGVGDRKPSPSRQGRLSWTRLMSYA